MSSTTFNPIAYIQGTVSATAPGSNSSSATPQTDSTTPSTGSTSSTSPGTSSSSSPLGLSSSILSLLQGDSASSQNGINLSTLLGTGGNGVSPTDPLAGVYDALLSNDTSTAPIATAIADTPQQQTQTQPNPVDNLINSYNSALNAYNQTLLQTAQSVASANDYGPDGTPLVA